MLSTIKFTNGRMDAQSIVYYTIPEEHRILNEDTEFMYFTYKIYTENLVFTINTGQDMVGNIVDFKDWVDATFTSFEYFVRHQPIGEGAFINFMVQEVSVI